MAFKINKTMENGITVNNAYAKIVSAGVSHDSANVRVAYFVDETQKVPFYQHEYIFAPDMNDNGKNLWKQAYEFLKVHPDFAGAEDILEDGQDA